jgi:hypothetical protein
MRNRFTRGLCVLAASAAITTTFGLATVGAASASSAPHIKNATTVCGDLCFDLSSALLGTNSIQNAVGGATGNAINLRRAGNARVNEDFEAGFVGFLGQFCPNDGDGGSGLSPDSYVCLNYPDFWDVFESNFAPDSNQTGLCVGLTVKSVPQPVSLVPCGASTRTLFIGDAAQGLGGDCRIAGNYCPWVAASDTFISHPLALTVDTGSHGPTNQLGVTRENPSGGLVQDRQQFTTEPGPAF